MQNRLTQILFILSVGSLLLSSVFFTSTTMQETSITPTRDPNNIASPAEVATAVAEWEQSEHAKSYDNGMGADTTCARCKSPLNWNPVAPAAEAALDCASCKRVPGEDRPILEGGEIVAEADWQHITCSICHEPVGDSYLITPVFWNQELGIYEPVESSDELCEHCHEGQHGFRVMEEMRDDQAHPGWNCLDCHGPHGDNVQCVDCHIVTEGSGAIEHANHPQVNCSACHDQGGLALWQDRDRESSFYGEVITIRFAHTLTSWPSHNLRTEVSCGRCHHSGSIRSPALAPTVSCDNEACHSQGAALHWCDLFEKDSE
jgi:hypothetical protein